MEESELSWTRQLARARCQSGRESGQSGAAQSQKNKEMRCTPSREYESSTGARWGWRGAGGQRRGREGRGAKDDERKCSGGSLLCALTLTKQGSLSGGRKWVGTMDWPLDWEVVPASTTSLAHDH